MLFASVVVLLRIWYESLRQLGFCKASYPCYYDFCVRRATCLDKPSQIKIPFNKLYASPPHHLQCCAAIVAFLFPVFNFYTILGSRIWLWFPKIYFVSIRITYLLPARGALALVWAKEFLTMSEQCRAIKTPHRKQGRSFLHRKTRQVRRLSDSGRLPYIHTCPKQSEDVQP